jgi:putative ABC transport system permease protein
LFVAESIALSLLGGVTGILGAAVLVQFISHSPIGVGIPSNFSVTFPTMIAAMLVAATVGFLSGYLPAYNASRVNIVEGLRYVG